MTATFRPEVLTEAMDHIEAHPEEWYQGSWIVRNECGTTACLAGRIVLQQRPGRWRQGMSGISRLATELAGLTGGQASILFDANNTMDQLRRGVRALLDSDGQISTLQLATLLDSGDGYLIEEAVNWLNSVADE